MIERFEVKNHWTGKAQFTAEITVMPDMMPSVKRGLAVKWARDNSANLSGADLRGANLSDADLGGAPRLSRTSTSVSMKPLRSPVRSICLIGTPAAPRIAAPGGPSCWPEKKARRLRTRSAPPPPQR